MIIFRVRKVRKTFLVTMIFRVIPVPIPNTEVKPKYADNTRRLPFLEDRCCQFFLCKKCINIKYKSIVKNNAFIFILLMFKH